MHFLELAGTRYTTKKYDARQRIPAETITELKEVLRLSPSSINSQPWKFTFIGDGPLKDSLAEASFFNAQKIREASHLVVFSVIDDVPLFEEDIKSRLPEGSVAYYGKFVKPLPEPEIRAWLAHQVYLSLGFFLSACATAGIDSTPMEGIEKEKYRHLLGQESYAPLFAVALGYRDSSDANQPMVKPKIRRDLHEVVESRVN